MLELEFNRTFIVFLIGIPSTCREEVHDAEGRSNEQSPGGVEEDSLSRGESDTGSVHGDDVFLNTGEIELDSHSEDETWPMDESNSNEAGQSIDDEDGEERSNSEEDANGDQVDDINEELESDEDTDDE